MNIITDKICLNLLNGTLCDYDNKLHKGYLKNEKLNVSLINEKL